MTSRRNEWLARAGLVMVSLVVALMMLELGCRLLRGPDWLFNWRNLVLKERIDTKSQGIGRLKPDPLLGFVTVPGFGRDGLHYDAQGFRVAPNPDGVALSEPPILVVGDSIAHGDEIADGETWPSRLQLLLRRRVLNGGMSGYGFDQIVLSAEKAAAEAKPAAIILSFTADDTRRNEMKRVWGAEKPYFELVNGKLTLRNVPVPPSPAPADTLDFWHSAFGWSVLLDTVLRHKGWQYEWAVDHERVLPRGEGEKLSCALLARLKALGVPTLVVAEYNRYVFENAEYAAETRRTTGAVLKCAAALGLATLDLFDVDKDAVAKRGLEAMFRLSHPSPEGAHLAADAIAAAVEKLQLATK
jgi:lysophospholipase L1-like esterase